MSNFEMAMEAKLFCVAIIVFLWVFSKKMGQSKDNEYYFMYPVLIVGIVISFFDGVSSNIYIQNAILMACGCCYMMLAFFVCKHNLKLKNGVSAFVCALFFGVVFYSLKYSLNTALYILTFSFIITFTVKQYNKIRTDNLTKLYNRYGLEKEIKEQLKQYERSRDDLFYVIACDLDNFKYINDTWGHPEGDRALILIADALSRVGIMFNSKIFRIGGDEFIIISDTSEEQVVANITDAIKKQLDEIDFRDDFDIKMSIGAVLYDGTTSIDKLLDNADKKLYEAKK